MLTDSPDGDSVSLLTAQKRYCGAVSEADGQDSHYKTSATAEIARVGGHISRSSAFKVINFGTNRKPVCDFLLVDNRP